MELKNRRELVKLIDYFGFKNFVEVGVREGHFSQFALDNTKVEKVYAVDPWEYNSECTSPEYCYNLCKTKFEPYGDRISMIKGYSPDVCTQFEDGSLDFVYIDGMHTYEGVSSDIAGWFPKIKKGGILSGHDYHQGDWPGVFKAVNEFIESSKLKLNLTGIESPDYIIEHDGWKPSWWIIKN